MTQAVLLAKTARLLESAGAPFMVVGSFSSSIHGQPRTTNDLDLVVDFDSSSLSEFVSSLGDGFYVSLRPLTTPWRGGECSMSSTLKVDGKLTLSS